MLLAAVLTLGINVEIDPGVLLRRHENAHNVTCGIKVVRDHIAGAPGQRFGYGGETFTIPRVHDVRFYLEAHDLVTGRVAIERTA